MKYSVIIVALFAVSVTGFDWNENGLELWLEEVPTPPFQETAPPDSNSQNASNVQHEEISPPPDNLIKPANDDSNYASTNYDQLPVDNHFDGYKSRGSFYDIAYGKPAFQSSTWGAHHAGHAVNGNPDAHYYYSPCSCTSFQRNPYWEVDLRGHFEISRLVIYSGWRNSFKLKNFEVQTSENQDTWVGCIKHTTNVQHSEVIHLECKVKRASFIRIQSINEEKPHHMVICAVKIFGRRIDLYGDDFFLVSQGMPTENIDSVDEAVFDGYKAVDGGIVGHDRLNSIATLKQKFKVNLGMQYQIDRVVVYLPNSHDIFYLKATLKKGNQDPTYYDYYMGSVLPLLIVQLACHHRVPTSCVTDLGDSVILESSDMSKKVRIAEVQVFGYATSLPADGHIISLGKFATSSMIVKRHRSPLKAFDGLNDPLDNQQNSWKPHMQFSKAWLKVYLGGRFAISKVVISITSQGRSYTLDKVVLKVGYKEDKIDRLCQGWNADDAKRKSGSMFSIVCRQSGRIVKMDFEGRDYLVGEISVWGKGFSGEYKRNYLISVDKPVITNGNPMRDQLKERIVDGRTASRYGYRSCMSTIKTNNLYLKINLTENFILDRAIIMWQREMNLESQIKEYQLIAHKGEASYICATQKGLVLPGDVQYISFFETRCRGSVLEIKVTEPNQGARLTMCEIQVYGRLESLEQESNEYFNDFDPGFDYKK